MKENASSSQKLSKPFTNEQLLAFFEKTPLLEGLSAPRLQTLIEKSKIVYYKKGALIFRTGETSNWMYFVQKGSIAEFVGYGSSVDIIVKLRKKYDYIGEMALLVDEPYPNTAVALSNMVLIGIPKETFVGFTWANPSVTKYVIKELIDRLNNSCKKIINAMYLDAPGKLAFTLVTLMDDIDHDDGIPTISVTQHDLAATAGIARQTASKILSEWRELEWINTVRGKIEIINLDALLEEIINSELK